MTNPLRQLGAHGQSPWYDFITRDLIASGELGRLIREDGLRGMTTNPTIFEKAIAGSDLYDADIRRLAAEGRTPAEIFEALAVADVQAACDLFREVYEASGGLDGLVSIEVSPTLAHDTEGTIREAERLWHRVERANVMIKIPGTREGLPAITHCLAQGINVNVTLLFGVQRYREVVEAFMGGLEQRHRAGRPIGAIASVASFFVSRVDGKVPGFKAAIANAALAYQAFEELFATPRWQGLAAVGAMVQRPLWASTSAKDPSLPDVYYVEALVGDRTVNTLPPATFAAYRDHGQPARRIHEAVATAPAVLADLARQGINLEHITPILESEGVSSFAASFASLLAVIEKKAAVLV
ncbi:MAG: transaldolase [Gemmatimonadetes bacterium]|jgi:transaldolase|nr:transaldolase [Gemmatimonadota bacterium]MBP9200546.1 transaldolase [Gemmatimonadales bacterium]MBK6781900.1 transaldolase [Gemmatimonadota bacterium]MBK7352021.1 transaldolase [Gemmatimonadota bacterium]MBK7717199.1 transaldolase [Gemmatimonadota bacterium]